MKLFNRKERWWNSMKSKGNKKSNWLLKIKFLIVFSVALIFALFFYFGFDQYFQLEFFLSKKQDLDLLYQNQPFLFVSVFFLVYVLCAALSLPGVAFLTLTAGFLFDFVLGVVVVCLASNTGATLAFLTSRFLFRDYVQTKFHSRLQAVDKGFKKEGAFYLFSIRLVPLFPFFVVNLLMGLTSISLRPFVTASFLGMLPGTAAYVNAGKQLSHVDSLSGILSLPVIFSFCLLAALPWIVKFLLKVFFKGKTFVKKKRT